MKHFKSIQGFLTEIPRLRSEGILDESTADRLEKFYRKELESPSVRNLLFGILGVLGAMLIAGGIVLFTAHNWDMLPKQGRIAIAFLPFLLSAAFAAFTLIRRKGEVWREGAAVLSAAGIVSLNALISQIYHIEGEMFDFLSLNLLFALALMYLFDSRVLSLLTAIFLIVFAVSDGAAGWTIFLPPVYTLFWIPFAVCRLRKSVSISTRYAAIAAAIALLCTRQADAAVLFPLAAAFFFCGGLNLRQSGKTAWFRDPWIQAAFAGMTVYLLILGNMQKFLPADFKPTGTNLLLCAVFGCALISQLYRHTDALNLMLAFFAALPFFLLPLETEPRLLTATGFLLFSGVIFLIDGFRKADLLLLNFGQLQLYALLIVHFFDSRYSILARSGVFLGAGTAFLVLNCWLSHHFGRKGGKIG